MTGRSTDDSRAVAQRLYRARTGNDLPSILACLAPDVVVHEPGFLPYGGVYRGHGELRTLLRHIARVLDVSRFSVDHIIADGDQAIGLLRIPDRATGHDGRFAEQLTIHDHEVVDMRIFCNDAQSLPWLAAATLTESATRGENA